MRRFPMAWIVLRRRCLDSDFYRPRGGAGVVGVGDVKCWIFASSSSRRRASWSRRRSICSIFSVGEASMIAFLSCGAN